MEALRVKGEVWPDVRFLDLGGDGRLRFLLHPLLLEARNVQVGYPIVGVATPIKICPKCKRTHHLDAQVCPCGHTFRTQFVPTGHGAIPRPGPQTVGNKMAPPTVVFVVALVLACIAWLAVTKWGPRPAKAAPSGGIEVVWLPYGGDGYLLDISSTYKVPLTQFTVYVEMPTKRNGLVDRNDTVPVTVRFASNKAKNHVDSGSGVLSQSITIDPGETLRATLFGVGQLDFPAPIQARCKEYSAVSVTQRQGTLDDMAK